MLQNVDKYENCYCYRDGKSPMVEIIENETEGSIYLHEQAIIFNIKGSVCLTVENNNTTKRLRAKEFVFMPIGSMVSYRASAKSEVLIVRLAGEVPECHVFRIDKISTRIEKYKGIYALKANDRIQYYITGLLTTLGDGLKCKTYMHMEVCRILFLLHMYYPEKEYIKFFSQVASPDVRFSEFVRLNHMSYRTIGELAAAIHMTPQQFADRFSKVFGMLPRKWIHQERAQLIYRDICRSDMPLKEIAFKYNFSLQSNFIRFCRKTFGTSPGELRKNMNA